MFQLITLGAAGILVAAFLLLTKNTPEQRSRILKIAALVFCTVGFVRQWFSDSIYLVINGANFEGKYYEATDNLQMIIRWGYFSIYSVLPMAVFSDRRIFKNVLSYINLPFALLSLIYFNDFMAYFNDSRAHGFHLPEGLRTAYFVLELTLAIAIPVALQISERHLLRVKSVSEWSTLVFGTLGIIAVTMPSYLPQSIFGYYGIIPDRYKSYHIIWIATILVITLAMYYLFRFRSYKDRYALCLFLAIALFFHYNSLYLMGITIKRLPFQLCNIAAYFLLLAVVFKWEKFFHFCFIANTVGTLFAILAPDFGYGEASFWNVHFLYEHTLVLMIPALAGGLRIFKRLDLKSLKYVAIGFASYFFFCFVSGTILNGYSDITHETVNYFYMFDLDIAFDYFPMFTFTEDYFFTIGRFTVYPLIVGIIFLGYSLLCFIYYLIVRILYRFEDDHLALRRSGIDLFEKITGKVSRRPKEFIDDDPADNTVVTEADAATA